MGSPFNSVEDVRRYVADLDAQKCPVGRRTRELREEKLERERKAREAREQQRQAVNISQAWWDAIDARIAEHFRLGFAEGGCLRDIGKALAIIREEVRQEFRTAIATLRDELKTTTNKLYEELRNELDRLHVVDQERKGLRTCPTPNQSRRLDARIAGAIEVAIVKLRSEFGDVNGKLRDELRNELRNELDRLHVVDQERQEREHELSQNSLDARIVGAIETAVVKVRSEFDVAGDKLRDEFNAATSKLHDEINTKLARLPLEVTTWEPVREVLDQIRYQIHEQARSELDAVATLRREFNAATSELHNEINTRLARLPLVKAWDANEISYCGDVVTHDGNVWQARKDTGKEPGHADWILLARAGRDGCDGFVPVVCGTFDAYKTYGRLDIVECHGASYVARCNDPGVCPGDGWQIVSRPGRRGPTGETGPRGEKGERGARGEAAPTIISWTLDPVHYRAIPTMSNGKQGAVLDLRGLFVQFNDEAVIPAVDSAMDAAKAS